MRTLALILIISSSLAAQTRVTSRAAASHVNADQLGMTCVQILGMSSTDWVVKFTSAKGSGSPETIRAIDAYGKCYDARTDQLAAKLRRAGKGPLMGARGNFQSMEQALKAFTAKSLAESQPPADPVKSAYAALYEKQFRYEFYESYEPKPVMPAAASPPSPEQVPSSAAAQKPSVGGAEGSTQDAKEASGEKNGKNDLDPLTAAKNHFGDLLGDLPDEQLHDLHGSFGEILGPNSASPTMQLLVYRYAIFLLEPSGGTPFSPPPF
jgi:hypothetical protein